MFDIKNELLKLSDENYKEFNKKLCPDTNHELLGVRIPQIKNLAKQIVKETDWKKWLKCEAFDTYFEEIVLQGIVIGYSKTRFEEKIPFIKNFVPKIDSWAISDTFVPSLKIKDSELKIAWNFLQPYFKSSKEFEIRFAIIMLLDYYIIDEYVDRVIKILDKIKHDGYYVKMAMAWCLAEIGIKFNDKLMPYLKVENNLDNFTYNKALQKMIESRRFTGEQKESFRKMKRKK